LEAERLNQLSAIKEAIKAQIDCINNSIKKFEEAELELLKRATGYASKGDVEGVKSCSLEYQELVDIKTLSSANEILKTVLLQLQSVEDPLDMVGKEHLAPLLKTCSRRLKIIPHVSEELEKTAEQLYKIIQSLKLPIDIAEIERKANCFI
jgi:DNA-binding FrmR family transcriptional regulator